MSFQFQNNNNYDASSLEKRNADMLTTTQRQVTPVPTGRTDRVGPFSQIYSHLNNDRGMYK